MYDENPYTVISDDGKIYWVLDAYTISSSYPYSQYTDLQHEGKTRDINYIRNSIKVIIDAYDGTMKFYITDRTDPIAMAYNHIYSSLFEDLDIKANKNLTESNNNNDWEMMGKDIQKLQSLIESLDKMKSRQKNDSKNILGIRCIYHFK